MILLAGSPLSSEQITKQLLANGVSEKSLSHLVVRDLYLVDTVCELTPDEIIALEKLTAAKRSISLPEDTTIIVTPRFGTISPWSSKATDIAKNAGLTFVQRIEKATLYQGLNLSSKETDNILPLVYDRMIETVVHTEQELPQVFSQPKPRPVEIIDIKKDGKGALAAANKTFGFALESDEIDYLYEAYAELKRNPTDIELMMFAQVNSEHCRHKIFNADWIIDGKKQPKSLFKMIKNTYEHSSAGILSAYSDNAAILEGPTINEFIPDPKTNKYIYRQNQDNIVIKVETHNHPTAIAPFPGAATGSGGEIRDEGATGRGARSKMGLSGYTVSNLSIPGFLQPWEQLYGKPSSITDPLSIMIEAPLGAAAFVNEFGRPNLLGYFRTYEQNHEGETWGYHKPIMIAGGSGTIDDSNAAKKDLYPGVKLVVLGGPAMLIGLGGGAASSMQTGQSEEHLDFASVQRGNAEMERRAQEVISHFARLKEENPIISIHDVGAGGLSNALPELVNDSQLGAQFELRAIPSDDSGMSPMEIWCNESQERYVLAIDEKDLKQLEAICQRERCPFAVVGTATKDRQLVITDSLFNSRPVDLPMETLFGKPPKMTRSFSTKSKGTPKAVPDLNLKEAINRVLQFPAVGSKKFLITIGDRNVGGLTARDQMIGRWQVPVSDVAVTAGSFKDETGQAMAMGERTPLGLTNAAASARIAVGETITNILAADIAKLSDIKLSANWMAAAGYKNEDEKLYSAVKTLGEEFCVQLGLTIPVGKDSLSMRTKWQERDVEKSVTSPLSLIITGFSPVTTTRKTLTPELDMSQKTCLVGVDLSQGKKRLGGSSLYQVQNYTGSETPDIKAEVLKRFFESITALKASGSILAYHDISDGGLVTTLLEMAFTVRAGLDITLDTASSVAQQLFSEELGAVLQVAEPEAESVVDQLNKALPGSSRVVAKPTRSEEIVITQNDQQLFKGRRSDLEELWSKTSYEIQKLRDTSNTANEEFSLISDKKNTGLFSNNEPALRNETYNYRPKVAVFREEGVNGQIEMAAAFYDAGFEPVDVHLNDIKNNPKLLKDFSGLVACGGFSYGDVLGAGKGWANAILFNAELKKAFLDFFSRPDTFSLGVCNGCQMLSGLKELIPGADGWPDFVKNKSEQFEARLVMAEVLESNSIFFSGMKGAMLPIPVAHGEGRAVFDSRQSAKIKASQPTLRYVAPDKRPTEVYPHNPNGSEGGATAFTTLDGRVTIMMPHPERAFLTKQMSWHPEAWQEYTPWFRMFQNARSWLDKNKKD